MNMFQKIFRPLDKGSLRYVVMLWIRMTMGVGILTLPALLSNFGLLGGIFFICLGAFLSLVSFRLIISVSVLT